jgi:hypothetical protein
MPDDSTKRRSIRAAMGAVAVALAAVGTAIGADDGTRLRLEAAIRFLSDDLLEGRGTPSPGVDLAALYLSTELLAAGWSPAAEGGFLQRYAVRDYAPQEAEHRVVILGRELSEDEFLLMNWGLDPERTPKRYKMVFGGFGVVAPEREVNDLAGLVLRDRAVVVLEGAPWPLDPAAPFGYDRAIGKSIEATVRGADLLVYVSQGIFPGDEVPPNAERDLLLEATRARPAHLPDFGGEPTMGLGTILAISPDAFDRTLAEVAGGSYFALSQRLASGARMAGPLRGVLELEIDVEVETGEASNVIGALPGTDPEIGDEWVVLTAHYDHLGAYEAPDGEDGIRNGADDNASGTSVVLEIARRLAAAAPLKRGVLVLLVSGEERGLLGSAYYSTRPTVLAERVVVDINVDMVGRSTGTVQALVDGSPELFEHAVETGKQLGIAVLPDQQPSWRLQYLTDHYHFARFDVPTIEFFTGLHDDYHQPTDEADRIRYDEMGRILDVMYELALHYAQGGVKPKYERPEWFLVPE